MPPTTKDPKTPLNSEHVDWLKKISPLLGVALNVITPQGGAAPTSSTAAAPKTSAAALEATRSTSDAMRLVGGGGGYVFEQHADGKIFIVESPKHGKDRIQVTDQKAYQAILAEIGPFPKTPSPPPSENPSKTPTPTPNTQAGLGSGNGLQDMMNTLGTTLDNATGHLFTQSADQPKAAAAGPRTAHRIVAPPTQDSYRNQRDNPELGDKSCNVTSLAMQLLSLAGGDETKLRETAVALLKKRGVTASTSTQLEELLRQLAIKVGGGETVPLAGGKTSPSWQMAWVLDGVSELFTDYVTKTETIAGVASKEMFQEKIVPALAKGAVVMLANKLTSSGHIVKLNEVLADGILLDDPFGCLVEKQGGYLKNGATLGQKQITRINDNAAALDSRLKSNATLRKTFTDLAAAKTGAIPGNAGNDNFYSWDEVKTYNIGKWANVTYKK